MLLAPCLIHRLLFNNSVKAEPLEYYFTEHPQVSNALIDALLDIGVSMIGVDFAGVRRGKEHSPKDQYCADRGVFIIENLCNLKAVPMGECIMNTYPTNYAEMTGLPCRIVAEIESYISA